MLIKHELIDQNQNRKIAATCHHRLAAAETFKYKQITYYGSSLYEPWSTAATTRASCRLRNVLLSWR